jgi:hypothetical protein
MVLRKMLDNVMGKFIDLTRQRFGRLIEKALQYQSERKKC